MNLTLPFDVNSMAAVVGVIYILLGVTVWLWRTRGERWVWFVTGIPTVLMYVMSTWALISMTWPKFFDKAGSFTTPSEVVPWIGVVCSSPPPP